MVDLASAVGVLVFATGVTILFVAHSEAIREAIEAFGDRFRGGGPPTPMHPSPAADGALLRRRPHKSDSHC